MNDGDLHHDHLKEQPETEVPFVPYVSEAFSEDNEAQKKRRRLLIPIIVAAVLGLIYLVMSLQKKNNFYQKTLSALKFDYRSGETVLAEDDSIIPGERAKAIAENLLNRSVQIDAVSYYLDPDRTLSDDIAEYQFTRNGEGDTADITVGTAGSLSSSTQTVRRTGSGTKIRKNDSWENATGIALPQLYEYCFLAASNNSVSISCESAYETYVNSTRYTCELWLMQSGGTYYTLYRYYDGSTLKAVRVLNSQDDLMCVYDIRNYSIL